MSFPLMLAFVRPVESAVPAVVVAVAGSAPLLAEADGEAELSAEADVEAVAEADASDEGDASAEV